MSNNDGLMTAQPATAESSSTLALNSASTTAPSSAVNTTPSSAVDTAPSAAVDTTPSTAPSAAQVRAAQSKELQLKRQAHATTGVMERFHAAPAGREAVPQPNAAARDKAEGFYPCSGPQFTFLKKYFRSTQVQEVVAEDGAVLRVTFKPNTLDEALKLVLACEALKPNQRGLFLDQLRDYFLAPNGLGPKDHQKTRALLEALAPSHILALAQNLNDPWWQALLQEAQSAWGDPNEAGLSCCEFEIPVKPKAEHAVKLIQALGERRKLWPELLRFLCDDLIKPLSICQPSKLHDFMEYVKALLKLSSQELLNQFMELSQRLPQDFSFDALIHPKEFADADCDMRKRLHATMIAPKASKKASKKSSSKQSSTKKVAAKTQRKSNVAPSVAPVSTSASTEATSAPVAATAISTEATSAPVAATAISTEGTSVPAAATADSTEATSVQAAATTASTEATSAPVEATAPTPASATVAAAQGEPVKLELEAFMSFDEDDESVSADDDASDATSVDAVSNAAVATVPVEAEVGTPGVVGQRYEVAFDFSGLEAQGLLPKRSGKRVKTHELKRAHKRFNKQVRKQRKIVRRRM